MQLSLVQLSYETTEKSMLMFHLIVTLVVYHHNRSRGFKSVRDLRCIKRLAVRPLSDSKLSRSARVLKSDTGLLLVF